LRAGGRSLLVDLVAAPVRGTGGTADPAGVVVTLRDVTARAGQERALRGDVDALTATTHELERSLKELAEARASLQERNAQLERLNGELRSLDEMKSNLLANVSHELHTPLVSIKGYTEMILKRKLGPLTPEQERGLLVAQKNIDRLIELIDNLLSFARLETGETQLRIEDVPLFQLVDEAIELVAERVKRRNIAITTQYEGDDLVVRGDRVKIGQVFTNLLTNAVKFNREGGRIAVAARRGRGGFVEVEVADTGIGIPPEEQEKIFERFYQVEAGPRRRYEGTGIGLAIVRDILRLHGGSIRVQSTPGQGSTFQFTLPLGRKPDGSAPQPSGRSRTSDTA
ncbi:MAG TPA: HAMP domain-containing sensor histidine kinase, partial [Candidatus Polarisedimenticolia bacterium]|nr:HAMP domain-containing sensor histidine kinase [Candidatus Polarisedimenticolia bacterium]